MDVRIYEKICKCFVFIRAHSSDPEEAGFYISEMKDLCGYISLNAKSPEKEILCYCIDTLFEIYEQNDSEKLLCYCDAVHNICELFYKNTWNMMDYRDLYINMFRKKYGRNYFQEIEKYFR